jgi:hypothetical protein
VGPTSQDFLIFYLVLLLLRSSQSSPSRRPALPRHNRPSLLAADGGRSARSWLCVLLAKPWPCPRPARPLPAMPWRVGWLLRQDVVLLLLPAGELDADGRRPWHCMCPLCYHPARQQTDDHATPAHYLASVSRPRRTTAGQPPYRSLRAGARSRVRICCRLNPPTAAPVRAGLGRHPPRRPTDCSALTWRPRAPPSYLQCSPLHACAGASSTTLSTHGGSAGSFERQPQLGRASMAVRRLASQRRRPPALTHQPAMATLDSWVESERRGKG